LDNLAPIVLFVYNRPWHTQQTVEALQKNELAKESELFIYSDEAKSDDVRKSVDEVREYIDKINGFKKVTVIKREKNWGLADSIIDGVTKIINEYGKIIVLEDDLVTSPYFLKFMNDALEFYEDEEKVWHISGWNYPIETDGLDDVFLWRLMNCWGWATWADRWQYFEKNTNKLIDEFSQEQIKYLNLEDFNNAWSQVKLNKKNEIKTWAIYWYATIVKNNKLCLNPTKTFVTNIGLDGSGENCGSDSSYSNIMSTQNKIIFSMEFIENKLALGKIQNFHKKQKQSFLMRVFNKTKRLLNVT